MIITFGTQKGGAGKTTLAIAFANYLALQDKKIMFLILIFKNHFIINGKKMKDWTFQNCMK